MPAVTKSNGKTKREIRFSSQTIVRPPRDGVRYDEVSP